MKKLAVVNNASRDYVLPIIVGETYPHREVFKEHGFYFSPVQQTGGPGWNGCPFRMGVYSSVAFQKFATLTKKLSELDADVTVYLVNA